MELASRWTRCVFAIKRLILAEALADASCTIAIAVSWTGTIHGAIKVGDIAAHSFISIGTIADSVTGVTGTMARAVQCTFRVTAIIRHVRNEAGAGTTRLVANSVRAATIRARKVWNIACDASIVGKAAAKAAGVADTISAAVTGT